MKRWILPVVIVLALAAPVIGDLYELVAERSVHGVGADVSLLDSGTFRFETGDWLIDLRDRPNRAEKLFARPVYLLDEGWSQPRTEGAWISDERASLRISLPQGGQRTLLIHCRPDRDQRPPPLVTALLNGIHCGSVRLERKMAVYRFDLPVGVVDPGMNTLTIDLEDDPPYGLASGRTLLVRRLAFSKDIAAGFDDIHATRPLRWHRERGRVSVSQPGRLVMFFDVAGPGRKLEFQYRLLKRADDAACDVEVGRWYADLETVDVVNRMRITPSKRRVKRFRYNFGNHMGSALLAVTIDDVVARAGLEIVEPRIVAGP